MNLPLSHAPALPPMGLPLLLRALCKRAAAGAPALAASGASFRIDGIDPAHVRRYNAAFGFPGEAIPPTFLYLLAQRAQLASLLALPIPFRIPGLIHLDNTLAVHGAPRCDAPLVLTTTLALPPPAANGAVQCVLRTEAFDGARLAFSCASTYLIRRGARGSGAGASPAAVPAGPPLATWALGADAGRRYAALSGDWNPIHLWPWSARLMGMRVPIIHGMETVARACAQLQRAHPGRIASVACRFRNPVPLGASAALFEGAGPDRFIVACNGRVAVDGVLGYA